MKLAAAERSALNDVWTADQFSLTAQSCLLMDVAVWQTILCLSSSMRPETISISSIQSLTLSMRIESA